MKKSTSVIYLLCFCSFLLGGTLTARTAGSPAPEQEETGKQPDQATVRAYYRYIEKKGGQEKLLQDVIMTLDIGNESSRFYDEARLKRDSMFSKYLTDIDPQTIKSVSILKGESATEVGLLDNPSAVSHANEGISAQLFKERFANNLICIDNLSSMRNEKTRYKETLPPFDWKITTETDTLLGYNCQKATTHFRGRDYILWFSMDIPVNDGPWKFMGLPGLILKAEDTEGIFSYTLIGLETLASPVAIGIQDGKYLDCSRKEYEKQKKNQSLGNQINFNQGNILMFELPGKIEYTPMELE